VSDNQSRPQTKLPSLFAKNKWALLAHEMFSHASKMSSGLPCDITMPIRQLCR